MELGVFKRKRKKKKGKPSETWYFRKRIKGKDCKVSIGNAKIYTKAMAEEKALDIERRLVIGSSNYRDINTTIGQIESYYISYVKDLKMLRTWKRREYHFVLFKRFFKSTILSAITAEDIEDYTRFRLKYLKPASVNRELATLRHVFNVAKKRKKFFGENPVKLAGLLSENNRRDRVLELDEEKKLLEESAPHLKPIIYTALHTGMRKSEILLLNWDNVDLRKNTLTVDSSVSKSKKARTLPINSFLKQILEELSKRNSDSCSYVFLGPKGKPIKDIKNAFNSACRRAGIENLHFHDLRRTASTRMEEMGVDIQRISQMLGHSSIDITHKRYISYDKSLHQSAELLVTYADKSCSQSCIQQTLL